MKEGYERYYYIKLSSLYSYEGWNELFGEL